MIRIKEDYFQLSLQLQPGYYEYKYIVDGEWKYNEDQLQITDVNENINNYVRVSTNKQESIYCVNDYDDYYMNLCNDNQQYIMDTQDQNQKANDDYEKQDLINLDQNSLDNIEIKDPNIEEQQSIIETGFFDEKGPEDCPKHLLSIYFIQQNETNQQNKWVRIQERYDSENQINTTQAKELKKPHHVTINHFGLKSKQTTSEFNVSVITQRIRSKYTTYKFYSKKYFTNY